jgi:hypothetical protein
MCRALHCPWKKNCKRHIADDLLSFLFIYDDLFSFLFIYMYVQGASLSLAKDCKRHIADDFCFYFHSFISMCMRFTVLSQGLQTSYC